MTVKNYTLGEEGKLYVGDILFEAVAPGGVAGISFTEVTNVQDVTTSLETGEVDISTRANTGWGATAPGQFSGTVSTKMLWKPGDAAFDAIQTAYFAKAEISAMALDGGQAVAGSQGIAGNFTITNFTRSEPLKEAMTVDVTLKPSSYTAWHEVSA